MAASSVLLCPSGEPDRTESVNGEDGMFTGDIDGNGKVELCDPALYRQYIVKFAREVTDRGCLTDDNKAVYPAVQHYNNANKRSGLFLSLR